MTLPPAVLAVLDRRAGWSGRADAWWSAGGDGAGRRLLAAVVAAGRRDDQPYGPTESDGGTRRCGGATAGAAPLPIGSPVANTRVFVLDGWL